jgi:hypothetical protein
VELRRDRETGQVIETKVYPPRPELLPMMVARRLPRRWAENIRVQIEEDRVELLKALRERLDSETFQRVAVALAASADSVRSGGTESEGPDAEETGAIVLPDEPSAGARDVPAMPAPVSKE